MKNHAALSESRYALTRRSSLGSATQLVKALNQTSERIRAKEEETRRLDVRRITSYPKAFE